MESQSITTVSSASAHAKLNPATHFSLLEKLLPFPTSQNHFQRKQTYTAGSREGNKRRQLGEKIDAELPQTAGLSLGFEQAEDVIDLDCRLRQRFLVSPCTCTFSIFNPGFPLPMVPSIRIQYGSGWQSHSNLQSFAVNSFRPLLHRDDQFLPPF